MKRYSREELKLVRSTKTIKEVAELTGRSESAIWNKRYQLAKEANTDVVFGDSPISQEEKISRIEKLAKRLMIRIGD